MTTYRAGTRPSRLLVVGFIVLALVIGGAVGVLITHGNHSAAPPGSSKQHLGASTSSSTVASTAPPLTISSISPAANALGVVASAAITVTFSSPVAKTSSLPSMTPTTPGSWQTNGASIIFTPTTPFMPLSEITLTVPGGPAGVSATNGGRLGQSVVERFLIENGSLLRLQQLLSVLNYSPLTWAPTAAPIAATDLSAQTAALYSPPAGAFAWLNRGWPARLSAMWQPGIDNVFTRGLVMSFQADHGLSPNGQVGPGLWSALIDALAANTVNTGGYNYALANKAAPEMLTIYHDGRVVLRSPANTGIAASPTPDGTFPVNTRLRRQIMRGTNPNGQHYADLVQYIAYFHGNDAVHYMDRADYGIPQSLGCIELPLTDAARAWPYLAYGTLVTVIN